MKKLFTFFVLLFSFFTISFSYNISYVKAEGEFTTDYVVTYTVKDTGITTVSNKITLTNTFSNLYATSYTIILDSINPTNIKVFDEKGSLPFDKMVNDKQTNIEIKFNDPVVGKDKSRIFWVNFDESSFAIRTGEVWEVSIPRLSENAKFSSYYINLEVPSSLGKEAYISPNPKKQTEENGLLKYEFSKSDVEKTGIVAGFGQFQVFNFTLNYHLENPLVREAETEITLPPDTSFQKIYYDNLNPRPLDMYVDSDGNWIAKYKLKSRERVDVVASGYVQIFAGLRPFSRPTQDILNQNLLESEYWEVNNPKISEIAKNLNTPKEIYDYVSQTLKYDYLRVRPNVERLGALKSLDNVNSAICMEFTDLFVALARSKGIPAREINGFAYTENPEIQPLSLVNDVLHAWPEYYDFEKGAWIPVDPTWGSTTGGVDYFNKLDLRHFAFVIHGASSIKPFPAGSYKLGSNPQKDVFVSFGSLPKERSQSFQINAKIDVWVPLIANRLELEIINTASSAVYNIQPIIFYDNMEVRQLEAISALLPFQSYRTYIDIPFSFLGTKTPNNVKIVVGGQEVEVSTNKSQVVLYNILFIFAVIILIVVTILVRLRKISFNFDKIKARLWKLTKKTS